MKKLVSSSSANFGSAYGEWLMREAGVVLKTTTTDRLLILLFKSSLWMTTTRMRDTGKVGKEIWSKLIADATKELR